MSNPDVMTQEQWDAISEAVQVLADATSDMVERIAEVVYYIVDGIIRVWKELILNNSVGKVKHLALHAKKKRTRKKNFHRLQKQFLKLLVSE